MSTVAEGEKLLPSLLDRLTDKRRGISHELRDIRHELSKLSHQDPNLSKKVVDINNELSFILDKDSNIGNKVADDNRALAEIRNSLSDLKLKHPDFSSQIFEINHKLSSIIQASVQHNTLTFAELRKSVLRDLVWLLNTTNLQTGCDLSGYEEVQRSVVNFGIPEFSGVSASTVDVTQMERALRTALMRFEPRIANDRLTVRVVPENKNRHPNSIVFLIEGEIWAHPIPLSLQLKTEMDLENGSFLIDQAGG